MRLLRAALLILLLTGAAALAGEYLLERNDEHEAIPVLTYHYFKSDEYPEPFIPAGLAGYYIVTREEFERQLDFLAAHGYHTVTFADLCRAKRYADLPSRPVVITVDHEARDRALIATPVLAQRHMTASFYVVTDWIGQPGNCTVDDLRGMVAAGMEVGSHTKTHPTMNCVSRERQASELVRSKAELEEMLGGPVLTWIPPGGKWNKATIEESKRAGYLGFRTTDSGTGHVGDYVWPGITVPSGLSDREFARLLDPAGIRGLMVVGRIERTVNALLGNRTYGTLRQTVLGSGLGRVVQSPLSSRVVRTTLLLLLGLFAGSWIAVRAASRNPRWKSRARTSRVWLLLLSTVVCLRLATFEMLRPTWHVTGPNRLVTSSETYDDIARSLLEGRGFSTSADRANPTVVSGPAWPAVLAVMLGLRADLQGMVVLLALLSALTAVFLYRIARRLWDRKTAWVAALLFAVCPLLVHTSVLLIPANLSVLLATAMVDGVLCLRERPGWFRAAGLGILGAALALTHEIHLPVLPVLLGVGSIRLPPAARRRHGAAAGLALVVMALAVAPWTVRNARVTGRFVPVQVYAGAHYWLGEAWTRTPWTADAGTLAAAEQQAFAAALGHPRAAEPSGARAEAAEDRALLAAAWKDAGARPGHLLGKAVSNSLGLWFRTNNPSQSRVLLLFQAPMLILCVLGLGALFLRRRVGPELAVILALPALVVLLRAPLLGRARYGVLAEPMLLLPAAWCLASIARWAIRWVRGGKRTQPLPTA